MRYSIQTNDKQEFYLAFHGNDFYYCLWNFDNDVLRNYLKYDDSLTSEQIEIVEKIRDRLYEIMSEHNVDFEHIS